MNSGTNSGTIVIFGASGDLTKRKIIPALYHLFVEKKLGNFAIIGAAIDEISVDKIFQHAKKFVGKVDDEAWQAFKKRFFYQQLRFTHLDDYKKLHEKVEAVEAQFNLQGDRLIYCSAAAHFFCQITKNVAESGLALRKPGNAEIWHRIVYEKPFGHDLHSAQEINKCIDEYFDESQIYRIDHYLTKEVVSNISLIRFTNCVFEPLWNNKFIDQIQIVLSEEIGIESRGGYYDSYGVLADVVQNHMLELLALICMEPPEKLTGDYVREQRAKVLKKVRVIDGMLGQYDGYTKEKDVAPESKTDTFACLALKVDNPRWTGVPIYFKTGKKLNKKDIVINIKFKQVNCLLAAGCPVESNWLSIHVWPEASFVLTLNAKKPGFSDELVPVTMDFCHSCIFGMRPSEAYEVLFEEIMRGEQATSVRFDEIESGWEIVDEIRERHYPLFNYEPGTEGPKALTEFEKKHGMRFKS